MLLFLYGGVMGNKLYFDDIYKDFFGDSSKTILTETKEEEISDFDISSIDSLYIEDESKELLKKIIDYMMKYHNNSKLNHINFNIIIESNNKDVTSKIVSIINNCSNLYNYTEGNNICDFSLYKLEKNDDINNLYQDNNGIINIFDLSALDMNDDNFKKKFIFNFKENLDKKKITIISGTKSDIDSFIINDDALCNKYFTFKIKVKSLDVNDIYQDVLSNLSSIELNDDLHIKLLDYISSTSEKANLDYVTYRDNLCKDIMFNNKVPEVEKIKNTEEVFKELNELVGLEKVKKSLYELVDLINLKKKTDKELKIADINLHMVFLGNPGTGKTTVARMICNILYDLKYIKQNKLIETSVKDLVAEYVGQTAPKTMNVINKAMGGVLFIDEAYALADKNGDNSYNQEAIATLIKAMEDYRDNLVVIFAGYTKEMQLFLDSNSGIVSRIGYTFMFDDYTTEELKQIFVGMVEKAGFTVKDDALEVLTKIIEENRNMKNFGNARFVRNVYEKTVLKHANNTKNIKDKTKLKTITAKDICM